MLAASYSGRLAVVFLMVCGATAHGAFKLTDDDRVVLFGDTAVSEIITLEILDQFLRTRYPENKALVCNLGQAHGAVADAAARLEREVLPLAPTEVVLCFGLDGAERQGFNEAQLDKHILTLSQLIETLRGKGIRVALLTPPPSDDSQSRGLAKLDHRGTMGKYAEAIRVLGKQVDAPVLDWNTAVNRYIENYSSGSFPGWTRQGIIPSWYSLTILADLLLEHWGAEPLDYLITADWKAGTVTTSLGSGKIAESDGTHLVLALEGVPAVVNMLGGKGMESKDWPLARWFKYRLQITNLPEDKVVVSRDGADARVLTAQDLLTGVDMSTSGPLVNQPVTLKLHDAVLRKCNQFTQYHLSTENLPPEPELEEGFRLLYQAQAALAIGAHRIAFRQPSRFDTTLRVEVGSVAPTPAPKPSPKPVSKPRAAAPPARATPAATPQPTPQPTPSHP